jgi:hypothetical protein
VGTEVEGAEAGDRLAGLGPEDRERGEGGRHVDGLRRRGVVTSEQQRFGVGQLTYPRVAFALGLAELAGDVIALELELAQVGDVGPRHGVLSSVLARIFDRDVPSVADLEAGARGLRLALHWAARDRRLTVGLRRGGGQKVEAAHDRSTSPSGS